MSAAPRVAILWSAAALALLAGWLEVLVLAVRRFGLGTFTGRGPDFWWLSPAAYVVLFAVPTVLLALLAHRWPKLISWRTAVFLLAFAAIASIVVLLFFQKLHPAALLLLGAGGAMQVARIAEARRDAFVRGARRLALALGAVTGLLAVTLPALRAWRESRLLAALPAPEGAPNVLLLILDTVRASSLGVYGYARPTTPELSRWAARGVVFERAVAPSPWTLPSHASLFTGRPAHELSASWLVPLDDTTATLAEVLAGRGYATGGFVANQLYATRDHGLARGFAHYDDFPVTPGFFLRAAQPARRLLDAYTPRVWIGNDELPGRRHADDISAAFLRWLGRDRVAARPFFAFLNFYDAHDPYLPSADDFRRITGRDRGDNLSPLRRYRLDQRRDRMTPAEITKERDSYDAAILGLDRAIGGLLDSLAARGVLERTIVVVTSDHGEEFGEHGVFYHGHTLYAQSLHVPLLVLFPRVPQGRRIGGTVSLTDLAATILELAGAPGALPGRSLARFWTADSLPDDTARASVRRGIRLPEWYPGASSDLASVMAGNAHLIARETGQRELFAWYDDPDERRDIAAREDGRRAVSLLAPLLPPLPLPAPARTP